MGATEEEHPAVCATPNKELTIATQELGADASFHRADSKTPGMEPAMTSLILNEDAARDWVTSLIVAHELTDIDTQLSMREPLPQFGLDWQPREPGQEDSVAALISQAHHQPGVLAHPEHTEVAIEFVDDGDDWSYHFLLEISAPIPVTLTSMPQEVRRIGDDSTFGVNAAIGILREATQTSNMLADRLNAFVKAVSRNI